MQDIFSTIAELKLAGDAEPGVFDGYGAVFDKLDDHEDVIRPGAFADSLAEHRAAGMMPPMFVQHSFFKGGDPLPIGAWNEIKEDANGLSVKGKISALDTDFGKRILGLMRDNALRGLSIAFTVPPGGATFGKKAGEPKRVLTKVNLHAIDLVTDPSNAAATVLNLRSVLAHADSKAAADAIAAAMQLHRDCLTAGDSPTAEQRATLMGHLQTAHKAVTGEAMPPGMKAMPTTIREYEAWLRDEFGLSNSRARDLAEHGFKQSPPRDEDGAGRTEAFNEMSKALSGFSLAIT